MAQVEFRLSSGAVPQGVVPIPGDKSITHRAFLLGASATGETVVRGANRGDDCMRTVNALRALGVVIDEEDGIFRVQGCAGRLRSPGAPLDMGNSGTGTRLLAGLLARQSFPTTIDGDESMRTRPMGRIVHPLRLMGASITGERDGSLLPLTISGEALHGIRYETPVASAQVKSAILLAGLGAEGETVLVEPTRSRDHTERLIAYMGGAIETEGTTVRLQGGSLLSGAPIDVGGDPSSAAFLIVAGLIVPGGDVCVEGILSNPTRTAFLNVLDRMGADLVREPMESEGPEELIRVRARAGVLKGTEIGGAEVPLLIDEIPILAMAGAVCRGVFRVSDSAELRLKESDRIALIVEVLSRFGLAVDEQKDGFLLRGAGAEGKIKGATIASGGDHRIAMAATILALAARGKSRIKDVSCVDTSFPEFVDLLGRVGLGKALTRKESR